MAERRPEAAAAERLAMQIWNNRMICEDTDLETFLTLTVPEIQAALDEEARRNQGPHPLFGWSSGETL